MEMTVEDIIHELRVAVKQQKRMDDEYECDSSNHVSNVVEAILQDFDEQRLNVFNDLIDWVEECYPDEEPSTITYQRVFEVFFTRLQMKHLLKGTNHRNMKLGHLWLVLYDEMNELEEEVSELNYTKIIEEALDVMISAMLIADRAFMEIDSK